MEESDEILTKIDELKKQYYNENEKNAFFKKKQKLECANAISQNFDLQQLMNSTVFVIPNTKHIYFNYPLFKTYANFDIYAMLIEHTLRILNGCIDNYGEFEMHVNLNTFSISAAERYYNAIRMFCEECLKNQKEYYKKITYMHIYHAPSLFDNISKLLDRFINPVIKSKIKRYTKEDSEIVIKKLYELCNKIEK
jgi:hypothetical protein